jgi:type IV pilus biogenesis protein CpaD/CtpE
VTDTSKDRANTDGLDLIQSMQVLSLQPGDVLVLKTGRNLTADMAARLEGLAKSYAPDNRVMILDSGFDLGILRTITESP